MATPIRYPVGPVWPEEMRSEMAAAYCDEPSVEAFLKKVRVGYYPQPKRTAGVADKWSRKRLEQSIDQRHELDNENYNDISDKI